MLIKIDEWDLIESIAEMMQVTQKKSAEVLEMTDFDEDKAIGIILEERKS